MEWHQVLENKEQLRRMIIKNVLPAIDRKRPAGWRRNTVLCQQDKAPTNLLSNKSQVLSVPEVQVSVHPTCQSASTVAGPQCE